jgi:hypothetical protein
LLRRRKADKNGVSHRDSIMAAVVGMSELPSDKFGSQAWLLEA